jgi:hypothetical protein
LSEALLNSLEFLSDLQREQWRRSIVRGNERAYTTGRQVTSQVAKVAAFILAQFAQQLAKLGRGVAQLGFLGGELWRKAPGKGNLVNRGCDRGALAQL